MPTPPRREEKDIGVRQLVREAKRILRATQQGATFIVRIHGKPVAKLTPPSEVGSTPVLPKLLALRARSRATDWSEQVDGIVYGT